MIIKMTDDDRDNKSYQEFDNSFQVDPKKQQSRAEVNHDSYLQSIHDDDKFSNSTQQYQNEKSNNLLKKLTQQKYKTIKRKILKMTEMTENAMNIFINFSNKFSLHQMNDIENSKVEINNVEKDISILDDRIDYMKKLLLQLKTGIHSIPTGKVVGQDDTEFRNKKKNIPIFKKSIKFPKAKKFTKENPNNTNNTVKSSKKLFW